MPGGRFEKWTAEEINILRKNYKNCTSKQLSELLPGRSPRAIRSERSKLGLLKFSRREEWMKKDDDFLKKNYLNFTYLKIAKKLNRTRAAVLQRCRTLNLSKNSAWAPSADEINYIKNNYKNFLTEQLAERVKTKKYNVQYQLKKLGLKKTKIDKIFIIKNYPTLTQTQIAARLGVTKQTISLHVKKLGLSKNVKSIHNKTSG